MAVTTNLSVSLKANETSALDLGVAQMAHALSFTKDLTSGTTSGKADLVWSDTRSVASGVPDDIDIVAGITSALGSALSMVKPVGIMIVNNSTTTGQYLTVGNEGTNPFYAGVFGSATQTITVQPGGCLIWFSSIDAASATAGTADKLRVVSASGTISYSIVLLARSA